MFSLHFYVFFFIHIDLPKVQMQDKMVQDAISNDEPTIDSEILAKRSDVLFVCFLRKKSEGYVFFLNQLK